ncbi:MAG TPA: hypothetical protein VM243_07090 [Phycisphaerae bacterium]|nr:hypothetical protein [Phycisphaerae bacterium]
MTDQPRQPDDIERLIAQVRDLEEAGVFRQTPVDVASLVQGGRCERPRRLTHRLFVGLQVAAGVALVVGLVTVWRLGVSSDVPDGMGNSSGADVVNAIPAGQAEQARAVARCLTGPAGGSLAEYCQSVDLDRDGDVDLADYGALQVSYGDNR